MDNLKKSLVKRKKEAEELQSSLAARYRECGEAQFEYVLQHNESLSHVSTASFESWEALRKSRINDRDSILNIKAIRSRQNDLKALYKEVDKLTGETTKNYEKARSQFLLLFFETYQNTSLPSINTIIQSIEPLKASIKQLQEEQKTIEQQKNDAGFLKKLTFTPQLLSLKAKTTRLQKKIDEQVIAAADEALTEDCIKEVRGKSFPEELEQAYSAYQAGITKQNELTQRKEILNAEGESLTKELAQYGVTDSSAKHIAVLTDKIRETDAAIEQVESQQGMLYGNVFYTADGESTGTALSDVPDSLKPHLAAIAEHRTKLKEVEIDIAYIENEIAYEEEEHKIAALEATIERYRQSISQYEMLIEKAENNIAQAESTKEALTEQNKKLKAQG